MDCSQTLSFWCCKSKLVAFANQPHDYQEDASATIPSICVCSISLLMFLYTVSLPSQASHTTRMPQSISVAYSARRRRAQQHRQRILFVHVTISGAVVCHTLCTLVPYRRRFPSRRAHSKRTHNEPHRSDRKRRFYRNHMEDSDE